MLRAPKRPGAKAMKGSAVGGCSRLSPSAVPSSGKMEIPWDGARVDHHHHTDARPPNMRGKLSEHGTGGPEQGTGGPEQGTTGPEQGTGGPELGTAGPEQGTGGPK